jgi:hypothetical protein
MKNQCLDEGMIQSYLDGELSPNLMEKVVTHLAACDACALALSEAQEEMTFLSNALEPEFSLLPVPSESLHEKINVAIADQTQRRNFIEPKTSRVGEWFSTLVSAFTFKPQYALGFASVLFAIMVGAVLFISNKQNENLNALTNYKESSDIPGEISVISKPTSSHTPKVIENKSQKVRHVVKKSSTNNFNAPLAGEKSYLNAIASLEKAIVEQSDLSMRPTLLAEYQRNLAVVDKAIAETQKQARRNPKDQSAAQLLYASYKSKLDLLNAVSNQNQLYASLR